MGGFFGVVSRRSAISDVFFGTDYHSHLGTRRAGVVSFNEKGFQREIHSIENSPFRTKFDKVFEELHGNTAVGCITDFDPQPLLIRSNFGNYAICVIGVINNADELVNEQLKNGYSQFGAMSGGKVNRVELASAIINQKDNIEEGIKNLQNKIDGSATVIIITEKGSLIVARDKLGRTPVVVGKDADGFCVSFESFAFEKLGYEREYELGPAEICEITSNGITQLSHPGEEMKICSFLWSYYGFSTSEYEGVNVEVMRYRNGKIMAENDKKLKNAEGIDYVGGVPDSGTPHAIGYSHGCQAPFARPFIKYTPTWARSFMPSNQDVRNKVAKMKQIPVCELIKDKKLLLVDDSIVRGTQLKETVDFLYNNGAKEVHMRSACPPIMYGCKYLDFSRSSSEMELISRRVIAELEGEEGEKHMDEYADGATERGKALRKAICEKFNFASLEFQSLDGMVEAIGLPKCKLCTYCWNGKE